MEASRATVQTVVRCLSWVLRIQFESSRKATCARNFGTFFRSPCFVLFKICLVFHNSFLFPAQFVVLALFPSLSFSIFFVFEMGSHIIQTGLKLAT